MSGSGTTTIAAGGTLDFLGAVKTLDGRTLNNAGTATVSGRARHPDHGQRSRLQQPGLRQLRDPERQHDREPGTGAHSTTRGRSTELSARGRQRSGRLQQPERSTSSAGRSPSPAAGSTRTRARSTRPGGPCGSTAGRTTSTPGPTSPEPTSRSTWAPSRSLRPTTSRGRPRSTAPRSASCPLRRSLRRGRP